MLKLIEFHTFAPISVLPGAVFTSTTGRNDYGDERAITLEEHKPEGEVSVSHEQLLEHFGRTQGAQRSVVNLEIVQN